MTIFDDRENAFESKFAHDEEMRFKLEARRNRLLGMWAAGILGLQGDQAEVYAMEVVAADLAHTGQDNVHDKISRDFIGAGVAIPSGEIRARMNELLAAVIAQAGESVDRVA
ncbi:DUF1476 domain-containing protein [Rhizobium sp. L1K21]|uniref:DUF1476 domain-containing protein n=1 Tax=Rhizobium sp. L1K21 TaxID=2954933 RepID=UPI00209202B4|nr:DUF1476 domain-containing protein [Rhizobium sp. L1K21]MCO6186268.1 DUF1476 domain-containing protein [Rhizobium sp. L1K21]